jgi:hypothetical protein
MRTAYSGRAAAYERKGEYEQALADHNQLILMYAVEVEILESQKDAERDEFLAEAAKAYRTREKCLQLLGKTTAAQADAKRADDLDAEAKKLAAKRSQTSGQVELINAWTRPATVMIDGVAYRLEVGERKTLNRPAGTFTYALEGSSSSATATVEAGKTMTIRVVPQRGP